MTDPEIHDDLAALLPAQFETLLERARVPAGILSSHMAPQALRAVELVRWMRQDGAQAARVEHALVRVRRTRTETEGTVDIVRDSALLQRYLQWLIEQYSDLELPNLGAGGIPRVPLENVYVALRADLSNPDERTISQALLEDEARRLEDLAEVQDLTPDQRFRYVCRLVALIARNPLPLSIEERDRPHFHRAPEDRTVSVAEAFQHQRRMVVLGDPGSGKTTLARWLTLQLARACKNGQKRVHVPAHYVDPSADINAPPLDLGAARVPIMVRVAAFAAACREDQGLSLASFLGHHLASAMGRRASLAQGDQLDPRALNALLLGVLQDRRAVVLVDGLDEIGDHEDRREIARKIDTFLDGWLQDSLHLPVREGGNQVIVTSRIVGYQMAPLKRDAAHLTIEPMREEAIARFCDVWVRAVPLPGPADDDAERAQQEAAGLKRALNDLRDRGAGDLTGNPLLLTILALVYRSGQATFPRQRVKLYETAVKILLDTWRRRARAKGEKGLADAEVLAALVPLAAEIHESSAAGVVEEKHLEQILAQHMGEAETRSFLALVEEDVGLLAARGRQVYGFLHLTFQEYLAAAALVADVATAADKILGRLGSPRWREPILMALGRLSCDPDPSVLGKLLFELLAHEDPLDALLPRLPLLIVAALPEMVVVPPGVVEKTAERLLASYANLDGLERFPSLREQVEGAFSSLSRTGYAEAVEKLIVGALRDRDGRKRAPAAARLVLACRLYTLEMGAALAAALPWDSESWGWPVDLALRDLASRQPQLLAGGWDCLRRKLLRTPALAETLTSQPSWRRVCVAVYGGLDSLVPERILAEEREVSRLKAELDSWNARSRDPLYDEANARLSAEIAAASERIKGIEKEGNILSVERLYRDSPLTPAILAALPHGAPTRAFIDGLWKTWHEQGDARTDAMLALAALGEPVIDALRASGAASQTVVSRLPSLIASLAPAVSAALPSAMTVLPTLAPTCPVDHWRDLISALVRVSLETGRRSPSVIELRAHAAPSTLAPLLAEAWGYLLSDRGEDSLYNVAVALDTSGGALTEPPLLLAESLAAYPRSLGVRWDLHSRWAVDWLAPRPARRVDTLTAALDALVAIPEPFDFVRGWALCRLAPSLREDGLLLEAFLIAVASLSDRFGARAEALAELSRDEPRLAALVGDPDPWPALREAARQVGDPYLRVRVYQRLMHSLPDIRVELLAAPDEARGDHTPEASLYQRLVRVFVASDSPVLAERAEEAAAAIADAGNRAVAFERLAALGNAGQRKRWLDHARHAALRISDRANRSLALTRLAVHYPVGEGRELLSGALAAAGRIADARLRAEILAELGSSVRGVARLEARHGDAVATLGDPWLAALATRSITPHLRAYEAVLAEKGVDTATILLGAIAADLRRELGLPSDLPGLWLALTCQMKTAALAELRRRFRSSGLRLTAAAAKGLDRLLDAGDLGLFEELVMLVDHPEESVVPLLEEWRRVPTARCVVELLLAETGELSERTIPTLLELLTGSDDRLRYRASIALHGDQSRNEKRLTTAGIGVRAVGLLARECLSRVGSQPQAVLVLGWTFERLWHTDGRALARWAESVARGEGDGDVAEIILRGTGHVDGNTWPVYRDLLLRANPRVQRLLLENLCVLLARNRLGPDKWAEIAPRLVALGSTQAGEVAFLLNGPEEIVRAAALARAPGRSAGQLAAAADEVLKGREQTLNEVLEKEREPEALRVALVAIGETHLVGPRWDGRVAAAAAQVEGEPELLDVLVAWLSKWLEGDLQDRRRLFTGSDLLSVTAAAAERRPYRFLAAAASQPRLAQGLGEAAAHHNTFTGRRAALVLLGYLRRITRHSLVALRASLHDVADVQEAALQTVEHYREIDEGVLPVLTQDLHDPSPAVAYASARMLASLARNSRLPVAVQQVVVEALANALESPGSRRSVYVLVRTGADHIRIEHRGRLDDIFFRLLSELLGAEHLSTRHVRPGGTA